jgi:hypothetical protein
MVSFQTDVFAVRGAPVVATMFEEFVCNTSGYEVVDRAEALRLWLQRQQVGQQLARFEGTKEELEVITDYAQGKRRLG